MKRSIAWAALAAAVLLAAVPAAAQSNKVTVSTAEPIKVSYAWVVTGLPGMVPNIGQGNELVEGGPRLKLDAGPPVPLSHLDFGGYEPFVPQIAGEALREAYRTRGQNPQAGNGLHDIDLTVTGNPSRTVASIIYSTPVAGAQVNARAGVIVPAVQVMGDPSLTFLRAKDLKLDVKYKF